MSNKAWARSPSVAGSMLRIVTYQAWQIRQVLKRGGSVGDGGSKAVGRGDPCRPGGAVRAWVSGRDPSMDSSREHLFDETAKLELRPKSWQQWSRDRSSQRTACDGLR